MSDSMMKRKSAQDVSSKTMKRLKGSSLQPCSFPTSCYQEIAAIDINTPHRIARAHWVTNWGLKDALRELLVNMIDRARTVSSKFCSGAEIEILEEKGRLAVCVGEHLLAEAKWGIREAKYVAGNFQEVGVVKSAAKAEKETVNSMVIEMTNYSSSLYWKCFLIGYSTKKDDKCVIGKHGEGLSGACVALNRIDCNVTAICSNGNYAAEILSLDNFVCVQLQRRRETTSLNARMPQDAVRFKLVFDPKMEVDVEELLNEIRLPQDVTKITTTRGELLVGPACKGRYFNRGIFVEEVPKSQFGYNFYDPDKNLLQGRDRNSHTKHIGKECGTILSEAIQEDPEVCKKVMELFLHKGDSSATAGGINFESFEDIKCGEFILPEAREALRKCAVEERNEGKKGIFCASATGQLELISQAQDVGIIYSHSILHNHQLAVQNFNIAVKRSETEFDLCSRIGALSQCLLSLLKTQSLRRSLLKVPIVAFWRIDNVVYVTGSDVLSLSGCLTLQQEYSIHNSLLSCDLSLLDVLNILRILRGEPEKTDDSSPSPDSHSDSASDASTREVEENCASTGSPRSVQQSLFRADSGPSTPDAATAVAASSSASTSVEITDDEDSPADTTDLADDISEADADFAGGDELRGGQVGACDGCGDEGEEDYGVGCCLETCEGSLSGDDDDEGVDVGDRAGGSVAEMADCSPAPLADESVAENAAPAPTTAAVPTFTPTAASAVSSLADAPASLLLPASVTSASTSTTSAGVQVDLVGRHAATGILLYSDDPRGDHHGQVMLDAWVRNPAARARLLALTSMVHIAAYSVMGAPGDALAPAVLLAEHNCLSVNLLSRDDPFSGAFLRTHLRCLLREADLLDMEF